MTWQEAHDTSPRNFELGVLLHTTSAAVCDAWRARLPCRLPGEELVQKTAKERMFYAAVVPHPQALPKLVDHGFPDPSWRARTYDGDAAVLALFRDALRGCWKSKI